MKGTIEIRPITPLLNKLVIVYICPSKYIEEHLIVSEQWEEIVNKNLIGKEVEFENVGKRPHAKVIFPAVMYSEKEVRNLVIKAWNTAVTEEGQFFSDFWNEYKKK